MIKFGTDGWRGLIARDFTFENIRFVALATARYMQKNGMKKLMIGYDTRFLGKDFTAETAMVLAENGIDVLMSKKFAATPQLSYQTLKMGCDLGVVITASHNPAEYNGYKLKAAFGGPATPEQVKELEAELKPILEEKPEISLKPFQEYVEAGKIKLINVQTSYLEHVKANIDLEAIRNGGFKILFDPMHGAGIGVLNEILPDIDQVNADLNPGFGNVDHPEPIGECLGETMKKVKEGPYTIGFATDGDADRLGAIDEDGNFVDSHRVFMILMRYLYEQKGLRGEVVKTVSLTNMVNMYCEEKGITLHETPVGFKYTAELMAQGKVLIGGEESGGLGTKLHIPERDGVFNGLLLLEVMAKRNMTLKELCEELDKDFGVHRYARRDVKVTQEVKDRVLTAAKNAPKTLAGYEVKSINTKDGFKFIVDGGWLLIRASGTEPLLRFYSEAKSIEMVNELLDAGLNL